ncbi:MAG: hypothetical protein HZA31_07935 [Opitutae bacterium]|nr:hypothetical protein [Opitutae bacterium]
MQGIPVARSAGVGLTVFAAMWVAALAISSQTYRWIERPGLALRERLKI